MRLNHKDHNELEEMKEEERESKKAAGNEQDLFFSAFFHSAFLLCLSLCSL
jgi:hypothetical protein